MIYENLEDAFYFVSSASPGEHVAVLNRRTGEIFYASDLTGHDQIPEALEESDDYLEIPHKIDLHLGIALVVEFVRQRCPEHLRRVSDIFTRPAAFSRYKRFLGELGLLEDWYCFEMDKVREGLLRWCRERDLPVEMRT